MPELPWDKRWVVFAKAAVQGPERVLEYLGRYVHRTALTDKAILACDANKVTFTYRDSRDGRHKTMTLEAHEFLRRFLQHVLPKCEFRRMPIARFGTSRSPVSEHPDHLFRSIAITRFGIPIGDFGIAIASFGASRSPKKG